MRHLVLDESTTLKDLIKVLDSNGNGFAAVLDNKKKLVGIATDGDIRRAILDDINELKSIINTKPITAKATEPREEVIKKLKKLHRRHMPIVDDSHQLVDVITINDFEVPSKGNFVIIMAGGLGTRLGSLTKETPKPMLSVGDKPMLEVIIENFKEYGFRKFIIAVNYKSEVIENYFGNGQGLGVDISYIKEKKRLGTAGAISLIDIAIEQPFFVINGDVLSSVDFGKFMDFHITENPALSVCIKNFKYQIPYACIRHDENNNLLSIDEKPTLLYPINSGIYILHPDTMKLIPQDEFYDMPDLIQNLIDKMKTVKVFGHNDYWLDIGRVEDFNKAQVDFDFDK